jgi:glycosyltransferase involved in cell wall biosynthesis
MTTIVPTLVSVQNQRTALEYVVVDGESLDGTLALLHKWSHLVDTFISEKDEGIYDAMNKGAHLASGEWLFFLNSGDALYSDTALEDLLQNVPENVDVVYGDVYLQPSDRVKRQGSDPRRYLFKNMICHQSFAVRKSTLINLGGFDCRYRIFADKDFLLKGLQTGVNFQYKPICVAYYDETGVSSTFRWSHLLEHMRVLTKYYSSSYVFVIIFPLWVMSCAKRVIKQLLCR